MKITSLKEFNAVDWSQRIDGDVDISANLGVLRPIKIWCTGSLLVGADTYITAGSSIEAGGFIKAGGFITAGSSIEAGGYGITAGFSITCKLSLSAKLRIICGVSPWKNEEEAKELKVTCGKLESGTVVGELVETGLPDETADQVAPGCQHRQTGKFCSECGQPINTEEGK